MMAKSIMLRVVVLVTLVSQVVMGEAMVRSRPGVDTDMEMMSREPFILDSGERYRSASENRSCYSKILLCTKKYFMVEWKERKIEQHFKLKLNQKLLTPIKKTSQEFSDIY